MPLQANIYGLAEALFYAYKCLFFVRFYAIGRRQ